MDQEQNKTYQLDKYRAESDRVFCVTPRVYNCAQAVAVITRHPELTDALSNCGGGRAPEGHCGALHAALRITPEAKHEEVLARFEELAGAKCCKEIKSTTKTSCRDCVAFGAAIADYLNGLQ